jgi:hypothetical protein
VLSRGYYKLMQTQVTLGIFVVIIIWLAFLTFYLRRMMQNYTVFTEGVHKKTLEEVLTSIVKEQKLNKKDIASLYARCDNIEKDGLLHIQKIGLIRFNPFKDTGGDQSFILSLVDAEESGVVITGLYSRSGTRWYAKRVVRGKGVEHELSDDEKRSLKMAKNYE